MPIVPGTNPALQTWNGQNFVVADGSYQNPISLPFLKTTQGGATYFVGADNNGNWSYYNPTNVTNANNLEVTATGSTTPRTLANRFADVVNVKDFGAVGNGVTDDTSAIQAAINSATPFHAVFFPLGTYIISSTINMPTTSNISGLNIFGVGQGSVIKPTSQTAVSFELNGTIASFANLHFDGTNSNAAVALEFLGGLNNNNITINNCYFNNFGNAILLKTSGYKINNCFFVDCINSINLADNAQNGYIEGNYVIGGNTAVYFGRETGEAEGVRVFNNTFLCTNSGANQIVVNAGLEISIFNNIIDQTGTGGRAIYISGSSGSSISHIKIRDNWLCGGTTSSGQCVQVAQGSGTNTNNIWIDGNTFTSIDPATYALTINQVSNYWVTNNQLYGTGTVPFSGTPFVVVGSNNGNIYGNQDFYGTNLPAFNNNTFNYNFVLPALQASTSYANDTTAAAGGVAVGQLYRNGSVVQIRVS